MSVINTNIASLNAQRNLASSAAGLATSIQRLSSGLRINSSKDDSAGLAIATRMDSQIRGSTVAMRNANDGISLAQTAEGDLGSIQNNLQRMRELAVQSANSSNSDTDRASLQSEISTLKTEIDRVSKNSSFNGVKLLDGSFSAQSFQIGANNTDNDRVVIAKIASARASELGSAGSSFKASVTGGAMTAATALNAGDVTLNGAQVGASVQGTGAGQSASSAFAKAAAINAVSAQSGVTATAQAATTTLTATTFVGVAAGEVKINGIDVGAIAAGGNAVGQGANVAAAVNKLSAQTGVTATADAVTGAVSFKAADGRDIRIQTTSANAASGIGQGVAAATTTAEGRVNLSSTNSAGIIISGGAPAAAGLTAGTTAAVAGAEVNSVENIDVSTAKGAQDALAAIDGALNSINTSRSSLGALQNRFESVIGTLRTTIENQSASKSRIMDADFASETAKLTRGQILQQAGTAMLAQANTLPNGVLSLLR